MLATGDITGIIARFCQDQRAVIAMFNPEQPVRVFKNWKQNCYSIMQGGRLLASARQVRLSAVEFRVRESGRQRMLKEKRRNVHAFAVGHLLDYVHPSDDRQLDEMRGRGVFYNPYLYETFVDDETRAPVAGSELAQFDEDGVVYA